MAQANSVWHACRHRFFVHARNPVSTDHLVLLPDSYAQVLKFSRSYASDAKLASAIPHHIKMENDVGFAAPAPDRSPVDSLPDTIPADPELLTEEQALLIKRDVSRMPRHLRDRMAHVDRPPEIHFDAFKRRRFQRYLYGSYGEQKSGVSPALAWPTVEEIREKLQREKQMGKPTLHESWEQLRTQREIEQKKATEREKKIIANMKQMKQHISEFRQRRKLIEDAAAAEQQKRQLLLEEARDTLGFDVDPRDPRFLELMEQRELELKKQRRMQKRQVKEDSIISRLKDMVEDDKSAKPTVEDEK